MAIKLSYSYLVTHDYHYHGEHKPSYNSTAIKNTLEQAEEEYNRLVQVFTNPAGGFSHYSLKLERKLIIEHISTIKVEW